MSKTIVKYLSNCFLLMIPIMLWNIFLTEKLPKPFKPEIFWNDIPPVVKYGENITRTIVFALTLLMPLHLVTKRQKGVLLLYLAGTFVYFLSWLPLIYFPQALWSNRVIGFMSPAYTPLLWLLGIGLLGRSFYFGLPYRRWIFPLVATLFVIFHCIHTYIVYCRVYEDLIL